MALGTKLGRLDHLTFKGNLKQTRYGWLRLTPAYSVHLVSDLLETDASTDSLVLDPFCGTGTTALLCAERGIACDTTDINPFLLWLTRAKTRSYGAHDLKALDFGSARVSEAMMSENTNSPWIPAIHQVEKWWDEETLLCLGRGMAAIKALEAELPETSVDLLKLAFCRTMIERANVSFGHQSMSFKKNGAVPVSLFSPSALALQHWHGAVANISSAALSPIASQPRAILCDARTLTPALDSDRYSCVITSPPYPNRMSYIRELRPYMYWLDFLRDGREAGELDWQAIGGTWGVATSNVAKWAPTNGSSVPFESFDSILAQIDVKSRTLSRYVQKYFHDMVGHINEALAVTKPGGRIHYIVGNSKFYDVMLPVEEIYAAMFAAAGFLDVSIKTIRKRTSKKELFEFVVSARKPMG